MSTRITFSLCLVVLINGSFNAVVPYFSIRSQSENIARELVGAGWNTQINLCEGCESYANISILAEYTRSFKPCQIAQSLFGYCTNFCAPSSQCGYGNHSMSLCSVPCGCESGCDTCCDGSYRIKVTGSQVSNRGNYDWLADYFGLPVDYQGCVMFKPCIENALVDFNVYFGMDDRCPGMYFRIHAPVVHTRWDLNMCECVESAGQRNHPVGYFNKTINTSESGIYGIARSNLVPSFTSFISGCGIINDSTIMFEPLRYAKMCCCRMKETALSDVQMALGWNFCCDECYYVGFNVRAVAPAGTSPKGCYLFEPIVGNGRHWEVGGGFTSHWCFWQDECECASVSFFLDVNVTHLFKAEQCRTFDLNCKPLSRYMLAAKFKTPVDGGLVTYVGGEPPYVTPIKQFAGIYTPVANLTTLPVEVTVAIQGDLVFMLQYVHNNCSLDIGYNFWGKSCEKIECPCRSCPCLEEDTWALKGDSFMYGYYGDTNIPIALSSSQSCACIYKGVNNYPRGDRSGSQTIEYYQNAGVDNRQLAWQKTGTTINSVFIFDPTDPSFTSTQVYTSKDPLFIKLCDIDFCGARTKARSHKFFAHFDYTWCDCQCRIPSIGIGGEVEFGQGSCNDRNKPYDQCCSCNECATSCQTFYNPCQCGSCGQSCDPRCCDSCSICALTQWGVWIKGCLAFN